jgi:Rad3-related DNA helicase
MRELIHALFPHRDERGRPSFRPHQYEVIRDTLDALGDGSVTDVIVEAPTGAGKTSVAVTVARVLTRDFPDFGKKVTFLAENVDEVLAQLAAHQVHMITSMKLLQDAYLQDDRSIKLVKGKSNYDCHRGPYTCDDAEKVYGRLCDKGCPYRDSRESAKWAPIALHNFDSFLYQATLGQAFGPRRLLTLDEGHNAEEKLRSFMTLKLEPGLFHGLGLPWTRPSSVDDMPAVTAWARQMLSSATERHETLTSGLNTVRSRGVRLADVEYILKTSRTLRHISMLVERLGRFVASLNFEKPATWVAEEDGQAVVLEPVDAGRFVPSALFKFGTQRLHLSATFLGRGVPYAKAVRLRGSSTRYLPVPSTFPAKRRRVVAKNTANLNAKNWQGNFDKVVDAVREILDEHKHVRGVIHCTSYDMSEQLQQALGRRKRLLFYDKQTRADVVGGFITGQTPGNSVLAAVALSEGYDFKDDLSRFQIIVRLPYGVPTKCVKARGKIDPQYYAWRTALTLVQTYGRGMRSAEDHCLTYILDDRFPSFVDRYRSLLPDWFLEAIS